MTKKKRIIILASMVLLLVVTTTLNIVLGVMSNKNNAVNGGDGSVTTGNFFTDYRADRQATRDQQMLYLDSILKNETLSETAKADASAQKVAIAKIMETETILEGVLKANGYADAVVSISTDSSNVYVIVKSEELTSDQRRDINKLITDERKDIDQTSIRITPVA